MPIVVQKTAILAAAAILFVQSCDLKPAFGETGYATYYTLASVKAEGNTGITASGEKYQESRYTCALRRRDFGKYYRITNIDNGKSVVVKHNDFGPGKRARSRGVVCDLSPAAYDQLGGKRGKTKEGIAWGQIRISIRDIT